MGAVLGVSLSSTRAGVVVLDGVGADACTVIRDAVAVSASELDAVAAAVARAARTATEQGCPVQAIGLTSTTDADSFGWDLEALLVEAGIAEIEMFEPTDATAALADVVAASTRAQNATVSLITGDQTLAVLADGDHGTHRTVACMHHDDDAALGSLDKLVADWLSGPVFVMIPHDLAAQGFPDRLERAIAPRAISLIDAELGLARGVALAAGNSAFGADVVAEGVSLPARQRFRRSEVMLVTAVAVTLLVVAVTVGLARGVLSGNEPQEPSSVSVAEVRNEAQPSHDVATPPSVVEPVSAPEPATAAVAAPPVWAPAPVATQNAAPDEAQLRKMTEPLAETVPGPAAPPVGVAPPAPVEEPAPSPLQDAITFVEQTLGIDFDNDGRIGGRPTAPAPDQAP
ncbi:hypothetical protein [[Mycobacterium] vasticus]|uniref:DUF7159 domain-containing protein n=1 Tax=[Mycobacterium] vasticus TaxID=2875777 RepID=A0ABU5YY77_9MYCO|nr:hypothetical protein [Mycolicibacter sp. MYC017]MEB3069860.1 hypothetical protein [Mycolicibacter sp. MYC017]